MDKEIYDLLNDMDINLDRYEKEELSDFEKNKYKKDINKRINKEKKKPNSWRKRIIVIAASLIILFAFSKTEVGKNTYAIASELFANIKYGVKEGLGFVDDIDKYSSKIGLVSESEGIKLKLNDVIVDRDEIYFSILADVKKYVPKEYLEDTNKDFTLTVFGPTDELIQITINDKDAQVTSTRSSIGWPFSEFGDGRWVKTFNNKESRDKGIFDMIIQVENPLEYGIDKFEDIDFNLVFKYLSIRAYEPRISHRDSSEDIANVSGNWKFEFTTDGSKLLIDTDRFELDKNLKLDGLDLEFIELTSNPLGNKIEAKVKDKGLYEEEYRTDILLDGYDNLGQRRIFEFALNDGENTIMIEEFYNHINFRQDNLISDVPYPEANIDFKGVEYIEFTPYYEAREPGAKQTHPDPFLNYKQLGEPFKLYLNK